LLGKPAWSLERGRSQYRATHPLSADGTRAVSSGDRKVVFWNVGSSAPTTDPVTIDLPDRIPHVTTISPSGRLVAYASSDAKARKPVLEVVAFEGGPVREGVALERAPWVLAFLDDETLAAMDERAVHLILVRGGPPETVSFDGTDDSPAALVAIGDGGFLVATLRGRLLRFAKLSR
jgi:hypothetical protein